MKQFWIRYFSGCIILLVCSGRADEEIIVIRLKGGEVTSVQQGVFKDEKFVPDGVSWSYDSTKLNQTVTREVFNFGIRKGLGQHVSREQFLRPLKYVIQNIGTRNIGSESLAAWLWKVLKNEKPADSVPDP